jgi:hypothetical protein
MPRTGVTESNRPAPHIGTQQWMSFEMRMRHRRAERCLLRAEAALDAGMEEEARAALDEARGLDPATPAFEQLLDDARGRRYAAEGVRRKKIVGRASAAAAVLALTAAGVAWGVQRPPATQVAAATTVAAAPEPAVTPPSRPMATPPGPAQPAVRTAGLMSPPLAVKNAAAPATRDRATATKSEAIERRAPALAEPLRPAVLPPTPPAAEPPPEAVAPRGEEPPMPPALDSVPRPAAELSLPSAGVGTALPVVAIPAGGPDPTAVTPPPGRPVVPVELSQERAVRAVLSRFEAAYTALSAPAAQQVWPTVDERSLARAFDSLAAQRVSLGACAVQLAAATARAECTGSATWTPKVGGGPRTEPRRWQFELALGDAGWRIVRAEAR